MIQNDYRDNNGNRNKLSMIIDHLSSKEAEAAIKSIEEYKNQTAKKRYEDFILWFQSGVFPIIDDFAQETSSEINVDDRNADCIIVTLTNEEGFDIGKKFKWFKFTIGLADMVGFDAEHGQAVLTLIFCPDEEFENKTAPTL